VIGKRIMSATFVTDFGAAAALWILFIKPNLWILASSASPRCSSLACRACRRGSSVVTATA
jgi:hypothetical protein